MLPSETIHSKSITSVVSLLRNDKSRAVTKKIINFLYRLRYR